MPKKIKCVVWDLDNTVWDGVLLEDANVQLKEGIREIIQTLDDRGILQSIASKNEYAEAMEKLKEFELDTYFIYPQIGWNTKAQSVKKIAEDINIGIDTLAFVDDQITEREEVGYAHPEVLLIDALNYGNILDMDAMNPRFVTEDSKKRRLMYQSAICRNQAEEQFEGSSEEFLATLQMQLTVSRVKPEDLKRVEELTVRTNQLNSTGYTYSYEELLELTHSDQHVFLIAGLKDKFGDYGKVGLALLEKERDRYTIQLLLMSCRVMTKGIGSAILVHLIKMAECDKKELYAAFLSTNKNRVMYITYKMMGFTEVGEASDERDDIGGNAGEKIRFRYASNKEREYPAYLTFLDRG